MEHSTNYIVRFVVFMTVLVALVLSLLSTSWKEKTLENEAIFNKRAIRTSVADYRDEDPKDMSEEKVLDIFENKVEQIALDMKGNDLDADAIIKAGYKRGKPEHIDMKKEKKKEESTRIFPLYILNSDKGKVYITTVRGNGLWDEIWGNIALKDDLSTVVGAAFGHKGETPGLGAEIKDNPTFPNQFKGKKIYNAAGEYTSVNVVKGGAKPGDINGVDGLSGATVTADGVDEMLDRGIRYYQPYFNKISKKVGATKG